MKYIADEKLSRAKSDELDDEEDLLLLFSININLEENNETVKASTLLGNKDQRKKVRQGFGTSSQLNETQ